MNFPAAAANGSSAGSLTGSSPPLTLSDGAQEIVFAFNPEKIRLSRNTGIHWERASAQKNQPQVAAHWAANQVGSLWIDITDLYLLGAANVWNNCETLLHWTMPTGDGTQASLTPLTVSWGQFRFTNVWLSNATINYERFTADGLPIRANVTLKMQRFDEPPLPTNPTSGGLPGRRSHTVVAGENLQQIATSSYGRPSDWRAIAIANGIEDPLRVHAGAVIYLPGREEIAGRSRP
jgi:nucleoid-associated protein YgaU